MWLKPLLVWVGEDEEASQHAADWYRIYILYIPFYALYCITWKFLSAQNIMKPLVVVCIISTCVILPLSLEYLTSWFGFLGSAMAVATFQAAQAVLLLCYVCAFRPHAPTTWPVGMIGHWREALDWGALQNFIYLGLGGILMSSEWLYWEFLSLMIGTLGVVPLSVHTVPTQFITVSLMVPMGCGTALAIRLGNTLPSYHGGVRHSKALVGSCFVISLAVFGTAAIAIYYWRHFIFGMFIKEELEPRVWEGCNEIWWMVSPKMSI
jgi:Na+-driven multidrug efflux pump